MPRQANAESLLWAGGTENHGCEGEGCQNHHAIDAEARSVL